MLLTHLTPEREEGKMKKIKIQFINHSQLSQEKTKHLTDFQGGLSN